MSPGSLRHSKLGRCLLLACGVGLVGLGLSLLFQPQRFRASARVLTESILNVDEGGAYDPYFLQHQFEFIQSPRVVTNAIRRLRSGVRDSNEWKALAGLNLVEASRLLTSNITLKPVRGTRLIEISALASKPQHAAAMANAVTESYRDQTALVWQMNKLRLMDKWRRRLDELPDLKAAHQRMVSLIKDLKVTDDEYRQVGFDVSFVRKAERARELTPLAEANRAFNERLRAAKAEDYLLLQDLNDLALRSLISFPESQDIGLQPVEVIDLAVPSQEPVASQRPLGVGLLCLGLTTTAFSGRALRRQGHRNNLSLREARPPIKPE